MKEETIELANSLSLNQMVELIELFSDKIRVYVGLSKTIQEHLNVTCQDSPNFVIDTELSEQLPATTNGVFIQINLKFTDQEEA